MSKAIPLVERSVSAITIHCTAVFPIAVGRTNRVDESNEVFTASN